METYVKKSEWISTVVVRDKGGYHKPINIVDIHPCKGNKNNFSH